MFVHLAVKTCYSLRDGVIRPDELAGAVVERGMQAVGIADRGGLYGAVRLARACQATGVRPIVGADLALEPSARPGWATSRAGRHRRGRVARGPEAGPATPVFPGSGPAWLEDDAARVTLLACDQEGYASLCRLVSAHHLDSPRGEPRLRWQQLVATDGRGVFVLLGSDSPVCRLVDAARPDAAAAEARHWMVLFGTERVLVGLTHHRASGDDARVRARLALADRLGLRAVADQAPRYLDPGDARIADTVDAVRQQVPLQPRHTNRRNTEGSLKTPDEMAAVFAERPDVLANTAWVAERCMVDFDLGRLRVPDLAGSGAGELRARCDAGLHERFAAPTAAHRERLDAELAMITRLGLASYFLTVAEIVERIRAKHVMVACRGSAAGSLVTYCLRIADTDPVAHDLCFERFANVHRAELPDIDLDVESARREDVYADLLDRYGPERVACVAMIETFKARSAIREVGKALGLPASEIDVIATAFPHIRARDVRIAMAELPEVAAANVDRPHLQLLFDVVARLDGLPRHVALHPSGVLLANQGLGDLVPMERSAAGFAMAQFDKDDVEALGLCKLDVLAVRMLSAMSHCVEEVHRTRGHQLDLATVPDDDEPTFELIRSTRTLGCFQIESPGQRELLGRLQPERFADLVIDISLFRPGPVKGDMIGPFLRRRHGQEQSPVLHPLLDRALAETHGVIVYHEQVMRCVAALTGCDLSTADLVRRRLGDDEHRGELGDWVLSRARQRGVDERVATELWQALTQFASFGFCKAHAAAFAVPTYRSAWLKRHYLPEFVAGLLTHDPGMYPRRLLLDEARQFGVCVLPIDINASDRVYRVERVPAAEALARLGDRFGAPDLGADPDDPSTRFGIRLSLAAVAGIDDAMLDGILAQRPFASLADLRRRGALSAPVAERLAHVGALDSLGGVGGGRRTRRDLLLAVSERWSAAASAARRGPGGAVADAEQLALFARPEGAGLAGYSPSEQVRAELEVLGLDASRHVVRFYDRLLDALGVTMAGDLLTLGDGARVRVGGVKVATQTPPVRSGQRVIFLSLDDGTGVADVAFFGARVNRCAATVFHTWLLVVEGRVRRSGHRGVSVTAEAAWDLCRLQTAWGHGRLAEVLAGADEHDATAAPPSRRLWHASSGSAG